jgi:glycopeptide antibiotics resistance protein
MKNPFKEQNLNIKILVALFVTYLWCLVWVIGLKFNADWIYELRVHMLGLPLKSRVGNNWIPFFSLVKSIGDGTYKFNLDHLMNVVIYIPMGILTYLLTYKKLKYWAVVFVVIAVSAVTSIIFEVVQLYTGIGGCDGTDFACNFFGGGIGLVLMIVLRHLKNFERVANIVSFCCLLVAVPLGVYMFVNTILCAGQYAPI